MTQTQRADAGLRGAVADRVRGEIVDRAHPEYEHARQVDNGSIDRRPELIVRCVDAGDVVAALGAGREAGVDIAVRGRGHSVPGFGTVDDGLVIDLSPIRNVRVDPDARVADVGGGAALGDVDHATHAFGLATPLGIVSATGVGGLTLGGGQGYLTRKHGLTIDNLVSADVVLADGSFVRASDDENADLMWALRGGSGNFGIVTSFRYRLHPLTTVVAGPMLWPLERAEEVMRFYRDFIPEAPEELSGLFAFITVPPGPPFPEELRLEKMAGVVWCWAGSPSKADEALARCGRSPRPSTGSGKCPIRRSRRPSTPSIRPACRTTGAPTSSTGSPTRRSRDMSTARGGSPVRSPRSSSIRPTAQRRGSARTRRRGATVMRAGRR